MPEALTDLSLQKGPTRGLYVDLERHPHGRGTEAYSQSKGIADTLGFLDADQYRINRHLAQWLHSPLVGKLMRLRGNFFRSMDSEIQTAEQVTQRKFNNRFVTYNEGGNDEVKDSLNLIDPVPLIRQCFKEGNEENWPTLLFTTNHALTSDHTHIAGIMRGLRTMIEHAHGQKLDYVAHPEDHYGPDGKATGLKGKTLILSSIYTQPTPQENGADLLDRLQELEGRRKDRPAASGSDARLRERWKDWLKESMVDPSSFFSAYHHTRPFFPGARGETQHISPAARRLSKFLLAMIVKDPSQIDFDFPGTEAERISGVPKGGQPGISPDMLPGEPSMVLREDASRLLSRVMLGGYSKGGNMVTDAMRLLKEELKEGLKERDAGGKPWRIIDARRFASINGSGKMPEDRQIISRLLSSVGLLSIAAGEVPLTQAEKDAGIRRVNILSDKDLIAGHFAAGRDHEYHSRDELIRVHGTDKEMGHRWQEALMGVEGQPTGYIIADNKARQHIQAASSQLYGLPTLWDFRLEAVREQEREYRLSFSPGVLRRDIEQWGGALQSFLQEELRSSGNGASHLSAHLRVAVTQEAPTAIVLTVGEPLNQHEGFPEKFQAMLQQFCEANSILLPPYVRQDVTEQFRRKTPPGQGHAEKVQQLSGRPGGLYPAFP